MKSIGLLALAVFSFGTGPVLVTPPAASAGPSFHPYRVMDPRAFARLRLPLPAHSFLIWNGLVIQPGLDYDVLHNGRLVPAGAGFAAGGNTFQINDPLTAGDTITVITLSE